MNKKLFLYDNFEGDKGAIIAEDYEEAYKLFKEQYPEREVVEDHSSYTSGGTYMYEFSFLALQSKLYCLFPW